MLEDEPATDLDLLTEYERALVGDIDGQWFCVNDFRAERPDHHCAPGAKATANDLELRRQSGVHSGTGPLRNQDRDPSRVDDFAATAGQQGATEEPQEDEAATPLHLGRSLRPLFTTSPAPLIDVAMTGRSAGGILASDGSRYVPMHDEVDDEKEKAKRWHEEQKQKPPQGLDADPRPHPTAGHVPCMQRDRDCHDQEDRHADPVDAKTQFDIHPTRLPRGVMGRGRTN
jgi:hypothetical protein